ncbi:hypothetical protein ECDEC6E_0515 [Escherichia coli DEC6E]|nr:hypothetical protein ECDEC6A_0713 [Escherichia coli DEC6A]EHV79277.1 hypothetical protein ECDEC6E_0515 [Escherichia coli DEC6E]
MAYIKVFMNCDSFLPLIGMTIAARYFYTGYKSCRLLKD